MFKKKKIKSEYLSIKKSDVKMETVIEFYDIHVYYPNNQQFYEGVSTKKEAQAIVKKLWDTGESDTLRIDKCLTRAITITPVKKTKYWFEKFDTL